MKPILVYGSKTQETADRLLNQWRESGITPIVLEIDYRMDRSLAPIGTIFRTYESYLTEEDMEAIDEAASEFARHWYRVGGKDITILNGISKGAVQELDVFYKAVLLFKNLECAYRVINTEDVEHIYVGKGVSIVPWAWLSMTASHNTPATLLSVDNSGDKQHKSWRDLRNSGGVALQKLRMLRYVVSDLFSNLSETKPRLHNNKIILAIREGRTMCATWFEQLRSSSDIDLLRLQRINTVRTCFQTVIGVLWFHLSWYLYKSRLQSQPVYTYWDVNIWPYWQNNARQKFFNQFPVTHYQTQCLLAWIRRNRVQGIVIPWHELNRLVYEVADAAKIPLIGLQDSWLPGKGFPPGNRRFMRCHHLLVWGKISADWTRHMDSCVTHIVGNPKAPTIDLQNHTRSDRNSSHKPLTVLLTHQCWGPWAAFHSPLDTNDMWNCFAKAARSLPDVRFVGKIHPLVDDPDHEWHGRSDEIRQWVIDQQLPNFTVLPLHSSMQDALQAADLVITYYSLTAVEALTRDIPVAMMNLTDKRDLFPELVELGGAPAVRSVEEFIALITAIEDRRYKLNSNITNIERFLEKGFGTTVDIAQTVRQIVNGGHS